LEDVYKRTNLNTLGAAALAGTGWPINRIRTMEFLGFDALCENTYDCVAAHDYVIEFASTIAIHSSDLSRLAEDLQIWSSDEFAMIDLDEAYAGTSSIMPQKKNPSSLEMVKKSTAESIGTLMTTISSVKGVAYTNIGDRATIEPVVIDVSIGSTEIMAGVVSTLTPLKDVMLMKTSKGFSTMTELADTLVRNYGVSFRQAHDVIAKTTSNAITEGKTADQITTEMIEEAAFESIEKRLKISKDKLRLAIDPIENVKNRNIIGGPAPEEVKRMIDNRWQKVNIEESRHMERVKKLKKAYKELRKAEARIIQFSI
jgi:argininosuccinate lyase